MKRTEPDKKLRSILFLALGSEGKRVFTQKNPRVKILAITFSEFWTLLDAAFNKPPNTTFERYKLVNRKQKGPRVVRTILGSPDGFSQHVQHQGI